jgi:GntR family transcriptional regulator, transcriptional repressor for pyruvate dehydrogenase complex
MLVTKEILHRIGEWRYPIGSKLPPEREIAQDLNVSRPTLRQALALLQSYGVLTIRHGSGSYVNDPQNAGVPPSLAGDIITIDIDRLWDIIVARKAIEGATVKLAATNRTEAQLTELRRIQQVMIDNIENTERFVEADIEFHFIIALASGNTFLAELIQGMALKQRYYMVATTLALHAHNKTVRHHQNILDFVAAKDAAKAARALSQHFRDILNRISNAQRSGEEGTV